MIVPSNFARRLERERDEANQIISSALAVLPVGYIPKHTAESIPNRIADLCNEIAKLERERDEARGEANTLATSIQKTEYPDAKEFELLGSVAGVISQIDNMYAGVRQQRDEARELLASEKITRDHVIKRGIEMQKERDEAMRELEKMKETNQELMQMVYGRNWVEQDLLKKIDTWRKYAEKLVIYLRAFAPYPKLSEDEKKLLAELDQLKEGAK
jgi:SMC interacting uncharacterized protein involved in chromosome segregation